MSSGDEDVAEAAVTDRLGGALDTGEPAKAEPVGADMTFEGGGRAWESIEAGGRYSSKI